MAEQPTAVHTKHRIMSMTLWLHVLEGRQFTRYEDDHSLMNRFAAELDAISERLGVATLSSFFDYTDLNANLCEDEVDSEEVDAETGWSYGIDDMAWFDAKEGLSTLSRIRAHLTTEGATPIPEKMIPNLLRELDNCIAKLTEPASRSTTFHLALVM